jgi:ubiquinone/menaquinone biosynthesis C-methylase UbiE
MYRAAPPWDTGRPQPEFERAVSAGVLRGRVLDLGCGTGEHVLLAAAAGLAVTGMDASPLAVGLATRKAAQRGVTGARFIVGDALQLESLGEQFDTVTDCGLFHVFSDEDRLRYVAGLRRVLPSGGRYVMLCFGDEEPPGWGPRRVSRDEIRASFGAGWRIETIEPARMEVTGGRPQVRCWLSVITAV